MRHEELLTAGSIFACHDILWAMCGILSEQRRPSDYGLLSALSSCEQNSAARTKNSGERTPGSFVQLSQYHKVNLGLSTSPDWVARRVPPIGSLGSSAPCFMEAPPC